MNNGKFTAQPITDAPSGMPTLQKLIADDGTATGSTVGIVATGQMTPDCDQFLSALTDASGVQGVWHRRDTSETPAFYQPAGSRYAGSDDGAWASLLGAYGASPDEITQLLAQAAQ